MKFEVHEQFNEGQLQGKTLVVVRHFNDEEEAQAWVVKHNEDGNDFTVVDLKLVTAKERNDHILTGWGE